MIRLQGVTVSATDPAGQGRPLLDCADLSIRSGEYLGVTGPNGAGKSLLLRVLAGLQPLSSGAVTFDKADVMVALVFQSPDDQIVGSTVERDLAFGLENHGVPSPEIRRRVDEALEWSGLAPVARQPPHLLSEGEKQRLALASALILRPDVLLLDEPTSRLDPSARVRLAAEIDRAHRAGTAVVHVTHRSGELLVAQRIVGLDGGVPVFVGTPAELVLSAHADGLGILWSGLHLFRRRLLARGLDRAESAGATWNDLSAVVGAMSA